MCNNKSFNINIDEIQPSQLYINSEKLLNTSKDDLDRPITLKKLNGKIVMTDGHSRAVYAIKQGKYSVLAEWDYDDLDWKLYEVCVDWCIADNIVALMI